MSHLYNQVNNLLACISHHNFVSGCRWYWFLFAWQVVVVLGALITAAIPHGLHASRLFWVGVFAVSTVMFIIASESFLWAMDELVTYAGVAYSAARAVAAGAIMTAAFSAITMLALGVDWWGVDDDGRYPSKERATPAGAPTGPIAV